MRSPGDINFQEDLPGVKGLLRISTFGQEAVTTSPGTHRSVYVNGRDYRGLEDNDLRGFVDGGFSWAWNQATQMHVRLGRTDYWNPPRYGEHELFRTLQRWSDIQLPPHTEVLSAQLELVVDQGPNWPVRVLLYEVRKDWGPGSGGIYNNNISVPKDGEVWWNDAFFGETPWGLPGAGLASRDHPEGDTDVMPLADALYHPGESRLLFTSDELASYIARRVNAGKPLLFLLKACDHHEDLPGSMLELCSGDYGDAYNTRLRPCLTLEWKSHAEVERFEEPIFLEYGRRYYCRPDGLNGGRMAAVSFWSQDGYEIPSVATRDSDDADSYQVPIGKPFEVKQGIVELQVTAAHEPVLLGSAFEAELSETWVIAAPPEQQTVAWVFISPTGKKHKVVSEYQGRFRWRVQFNPDEIGRWRFYWRHRLDERLNTGPLQFFDVLSDDLSRLQTGLESLARSLRDAENLSEKEKSLALIQFLRLQRAAVNCSNTYASEMVLSSDLRKHVREIRSFFWRRPVPEVIPLESAPLRDTDQFGNPLREAIPLFGNHAKDHSSQLKIGHRGRARLRKLFMAARQAVRRA